MPQVKKKEARQAILDAAYALFRKQGYYRTTLRQIAKRSNMSLANVYVYFGSKYEIVFEIYDPWMKSKITALEAEASKIADPEKRLRHIIFALWKEIPAANNGFARNIMQALSIGTGKPSYSPQMIRWIEGKLTELILSCVPKNQQAHIKDGSYAHILMMAFDGFAINYTLNPSAACNEAIVDAVCGAILGRQFTPPKRPRRAPARHRPSTGLPA